MAVVARRHARRALLLLLTLGMAVGAGAASFPPELSFRTIRRGRVTVHYHRGLEALAGRALTLATEALEKHEARYGHRVSGVRIVMADTEDEPNGFASPLPYPLVHIRVVAPRGEDDLGNYEDWLRLVLTHELAHIVHLDEARGVVRVGRKLLGRAPFLFPNATTPTWMLEGLATYEETEGTAFGRGRNPDARMVLRMAALQGEFPHEDRPVFQLDRWPGGQASYAFGESFLRDLSLRFGDDTLPRLARAHSARLIPYTDELTAHRVTGASFNTRWEQWRRSWMESALEDSARLRKEGPTSSVPLTDRGVEQIGPSFSPDGAWLAYTSRTLAGERQIRLMRADGSGDRALVRRNGGHTLSWTPNGRTLVYDEPEVFRHFSTRFDLHAIDVKSGRVRRLTRGLRARDPDVSPDGRTVVFVRLMSDRGELATQDLAGSAPRDLTRSLPGTQWSDPRWSPDGRRIVASRWTTGGFLDVVMVDAADGRVSPLTCDRAKDVEPAWTPDGSHVLFRSDRDGISNLYAFRLADGALLRVTRVLGGAFMPEVSPDGTQVVFADYSARGYDLHRMELHLDALAPAEPFQDPYPPGRPLPDAVPVADRPYRPWPALLPRFWTPYAATVAHEFRVGAVSAGSDPLLRHLWALDVHRGMDTGRLGYQLAYQYDRFWPTLVLNAGDSYEPEPAPDVLFHKRELTLGASLPLRLTSRSSQTVALAWRRRQERTDVDRLDLGGLQVAWTLSTVQRHAYSVSPVDGSRLRLSYLKEDPAFGSELSLGKLVLDGRLYHGLLGDGDALALRLGAGTTFGQRSFERSFAVGGFPDGSLFDVFETNHGVLRGYADGAFEGRRFAVANLEYRVPLVHPQRGLRSLPFFLRHIHAFVFADAAEAWTDRFQASAIKSSAGGGLGTDIALAHVLPLTWTVGVARGFAAEGDTRVYLHAGLAF